MELSEGVAGRKRKETNKGKGRGEAGSRKGNVG